jgi:hypothetical protein
MKLYAKAGNDKKQYICRMFEKCTGGQQKAHRKIMNIYKEAAG